MIAPAPSNGEVVRFPALRWLRAVLDAIRDVGQAGIVVAVVLLKFADNDKGVCWPSMKTIAAAAMMSTRQTRRALANLEAAGLVGRQRRIGSSGVSTSSVYTLLPPKLGGQESTSSADVSGEGDKTDPGVLGPVCPGRVTPEHHELPLCELPHSELPSGKNPVGEAGYAGGSPATHAAREHSHHHEVLHRHRRR